MSIASPVFGLLIGTVMMSARLEQTCRHSTSSDCLALLWCPVGTRPPSCAIPYSIPDRHSGRCFLCHRVCPIICRIPTSGTFGSSEEMHGRGPHRKCSTMHVSWRAYWVCYWSAMINLKERLEGARCQLSSCYSGSLDVLPV